MTLSDKPLKWTNRLTKEWVKEIRQALQDSIEVDGFDIKVGKLPLMMTRLHSS